MSKVTLAAALLCFVVSAPAYAQRNHATINVLEYVQERPRADLV